MSKGVFTAPAIFRFFRDGRPKDRPVIHFEPLLAIALVCAACWGLAATVVERISVEQMLRASELIFEGEVISTDSRFADARKMVVETDVTFRVRDIIKGKSPGTLLHLNFMGGTVGQYTMMPSDMHIPRTGEHGIYFVEAVTNLQINPLIGWDQGHFLVKSDSSGRELVTTFRGARITAIDNTPRGKELYMGEGAAFGVHVADSSAQSPLTSTDFKSALRRMLRELQ